MRFCKDCARFTPGPQGGDGRCDNPVNYHLVSGEPYFNPAFRNRWDEGLCGTRAVWFVPKAKPEGPKNTLDPAPKPTLLQKLKNLFK